MSLFDLEQERQQLERLVGWVGYEVVEANDSGTHIYFKVRKQKVKGVRKCK